MVAVAAGRGKRVGAYFLDQLIINFVVLSPLALGMGIMPTQTNIEFLIGVGAVLGFVYWTAFEKVFGQTPGKQLFGIKTIGAVGNPNLLQALVRSVTKASPNILIIDSLPIIFGGEQRITEIVVNTRVIEWKK